MGLDVRTRVIQKSFRIATADPGAERDNALAKLQSHGTLSPKTIGTLAEPNLVIRLPNVGHHGG
jgi:hypothetical protein